MKLIYKILISLFLLYGLYLIWAIFAFGGGCNNMEGEIHYIPKGFTGRIYIIFDDKNGLPKEYLRNRRLYKIPKSGILRTQFKANYGWINSDKDQNFYYIDNNKEIPLKKYISTKDFNTEVDSFKMSIIEYGYGGTLSDFTIENDDVQSYIVDSLCCYKNKEYLLTFDNYKNWLK